MKVIPKDKSKNFLFVKLDKQDLVNIYNLLESQYKETGNQKECLNRFNFHIDDYEIETEEDIKDFDKKFRGMLFISLRLSSDINIELRNNGRGLKLTWSDENIKSSGIANKIIGILEKKERRFLRYFFNFWGMLFFAFLMLVPMTNFAFEYIDEKSEYFIIYVITFAVLTVLTSFLIPTIFLYFEQKYKLMVFASEEESVFKSHVKEIKVGLIVALATVFLTIIVQNIFKTLP